MLGVSLCVECSAHVEGALEPRPETLSCDHVGPGLECAAYLTGGLCEECTYDDSGCDEGEYCALNSSGQRSTCQACLAQGQTGCRIVEEFGEEGIFCCNGKVCSQGICGNCSDDDDCATNFLGSYWRRSICVDGSCVECATTTDCSPYFAQRCESNFCVYCEEGEEGCSVLPCSSPTDCPTDDTCVQGICIEATCSSQSDCMDTDDTLASCCVNSLCLTYILCSSNADCEPFECLNGVCTFAGISAPEQVQEDCLSTMSGGNGGNTDIDTTSSGEMDFKRSVGATFANALLGLALAG